MSNEVNSIDMVLNMCFGNETKHKVEVRKRSRHKSQDNTCFGGSHRRMRYGAAQTYYPSHYYARQPVGSLWGNHHHRHSHGHFDQHHYNHHHTAVVPSRQVPAPTGVDFGYPGYHAGGTALMPTNAAMVSGRSFCCSTFHRLSPTPPAPSSVEFWRGCCLRAWTAALNSCCLLLSTF